MFKKVELLKVFLAVFIIILGCVWATQVKAQTVNWTNANAVTVAWDAVTVPSGTVSYDLYSKPEAGTVATFVKNTPLVQETVTFTTEGRYYLGVRTIRTIPGTVPLKLEASEIAWSNVVADVQGGIVFGVQYYMLPGKTKGMRLP